MFSQLLPTWALLNIIKSLNKSFEGDDYPDFKFEEGKNVKIIHSGSTSFDKIKAKPILDVLIGTDPRTPWTREFVVLTR